VRLGSMASLLTCLVACASEPVQPAATTAATATDSTTQDLETGVGEGTAGMDPEVGTMAAETLADSTLGPDPTATSDGTSEGTTTTGTVTSSAATTGSELATTSDTGVTIGTDSTTDSGSDDPVLTVVSFNVLHGFPDFLNLDQRTQMVVDFIDTHQPDVVAVQEIAQSPTQMNRAEVIASMTGYEWEFEVASGVAISFEEGPGVLSKWPIVARSAAQMPHVNGFEVRKVLRVRVETPWGEIDVSSAHLTTQDDETIKADQALAAYAFVSENRTPLASFLCGDMNATPDHLGMRALRGEASHDGVTGDLIDAWLTVNPDEPGYTAPSSDPSRRIDYVYVVPGTDVAGTTESCELVFTEPVDGLYASDHIGVLCRIRLE